MRGARVSRRQTRRAVAVVALVVAGAVVLLLLTRSDPYVVQAHFQNAGQIVKGAEVTIAGERVGTVRSIRLSRDWQADLELAIDRDHAPLRVGTTATIRQRSLTGVANRYLDLQMPPGDRQRTIPDGGVIDAGHTNVAIDVDQVFNTLAPRVRVGLGELVRGSGAALRGRSAEADAGFHYLDPSLASSARLFAELTRSRPALERFVVDSAKLATDVAERRDDLAGLVDKLADFTGALAHKRTDLGHALVLFPPFMRRANTTFVNLRATLDDLDPVIRESRPVARRLGPLFRELRPFARDARPTLRDLARAITTPGASNDLIELTQSNLPLRDILVGPVEADGKSRPGALAATADALRGQRPAFADLRPYGPDLIGWFDDYGHTGVYDANGGASRSALNANAFTVVNNELAPIPPELRQQAFEAIASTGQNNRCPGSADHRAADGSNPYKPSPDFNCDPAMTLPGD